MKTKILIAYLTYGNGHKSVANYIKKYFNEKNPNLIIETLDLLDNNKTKLTRVTENIFNFFLLHVPIMWDLTYRLNNTRLITKLSPTIAKIFDNQKLNNYIKDFNPDIIISTHFFASALMEKYIKKENLNAKLITVLTDYHVHSIWLSGANTEKVLTIANEDNLSFLHERNIKKEIIEPIGIPIYPTLKNNLSKKDIEDAFEEKNPLCIFFGGGGNGGTLAYPYLQKILTNNLKLNFIYIAGKNVKNKEKVDELIKKTNAKNIQTYGYIDNVADYLKIANFVISKPGGIQSTEALYFRKPFLMINTGGGQETENIHYFEKNNYGKYFKNPEELYNFLKTIEKDPSILKTFKEAMANNNYQNAMQNFYNITSKYFNK